METENEMYVALAWKDRVTEITIGEMYGIIKSFFDVAPDVIKEKKNREIELVYNRYSDGIFETIEDGVIIAPDPTVVTGSRNEFDREAKINAEIFRYKVGKWAVVLYKCEDNFDRLQWRTCDARVILYGRVPTKIRKLVEKAVEEIRQRVDEVENEQRS